jgi:hypothetical protein
VAVGLLSSGPSDPLRTYCPGPEFADVFGTSPAVAVGTISRRRLTQRQSVVGLVARGGFAAPGYTGARSGSVRLSLSLVKVVAGTRRVMAP